ncbi:MAG: Txe/YoeB family addiction module toxin [Waterburya sp.]
MRKLAWDKNGWSDYLYWQQQDKKTLNLDSCSSTETAKTALSRKRINRLVQNTLVSPFDGIGKPEPLKENLSGYWSRRIDETNRLVYQVSDKYITVISCRYHY